VTSRTTPPAAWASTAVTRSKVRLDMFAPIILRATRGCAAIGMRADLS
jgi:hypothetical protein